ncbi:MAG: hypothetical protein OHK0024_05370 [Thalassobaculales bacterium]
MIRALAPLVLVIAVAAAIRPAVAVDLPFACEDFAEALKPGQEEALSPEQDTLRRDCREKLEDGGSVGALVFMGRKIGGGQPCTEACPTAFRNGGYPGWQSDGLCAVICRP